MQEFISKEEQDKIRKKIIELVEMLPTPEQNLIESYFLLMKLREEQLAIIESDETGTRTISNELDLLKKRMDGADKLIELDVKLQTIYDKIVKTEDQAVNLQGQALKRRKNYRLDAGRKLSDKIAKEKQAQELQNQRDTEKQISNTHDEQHSTSLGESMDEQDQTEQGDGPF